MKSRVVLLSERGYRSEPAKMDVPFSSDTTLPQLRFHVEVTERQHSEVTNGKNCLQG